MNSSRRTLLAGIAFTLVAWAQTTSADTGVGIDLQLGNKLDPTGGMAIMACDPRSRTWLTDVDHRTPSGFLYPCPAAPQSNSDSGAWQYRGTFDVGYVHLSGDRENALFERYSDWRSGLVLGNITLDLTRPDLGSYVQLRGSRLNDSDQFFKLSAGRYGSWKLEAFVRDLPNVLSDRARSIWDGVGTNTLTLRAGLTPGASTPAQVAAVSAAAPLQKLQVNREKRGLAFSYFITRQWTTYLNFTDEQRRGTRPFGGPFFFDYPLPGDGGILETIKPIDDHTLIVNGGLRYAGPAWRLDFGYSGSYYRDHYQRFDYQNPLPLYPVVPGAYAVPATLGQFSMEPDNDYNQLRVGVTRLLPLAGEATLNASRALATQNDLLLAPINCAGNFGIDLAPTGSPANPFLYSCSNWNSPASLSQRRADLHIVTSSVDAALRFQPAARLSVNASYRFYEENYANRYVSYNPLTGQYGYVNENGAQAAVVPGEAGIFNPSIDPGYVTQIANLPLDKRTRTLGAGADWRPTLRNTLGMSYTYTRSNPSHRERSEVNDSVVKLTWANRSLERVTLRANYSHLRRDGDAYNYDPYGFMFSTSLPGYIAPITGVPAYTVDASRKYDLADRTEDKLDLIVNTVLRADMNLSTTLRGDWNHYDAIIGRQNYQTLSAMVQWEWQPSEQTSLSVYYSFDRSALRLANVNDPAESGAGSDPALGGSTYPLGAQWWASDTERNHTAGLTLRQQLRRAQLDASWSYAYAHGATQTAYASPLALAYAGDAGLAGTAFPANFQRTNSITLGVSLPVNARMKVRLFDYYEVSRIFDWHYAGFEQNLVYDHRVYADPGPQPYSVNVLGLSLTLTL